MKRTLFSVALLAATLMLLEGGLRLLSVENKTVRLLLTDLSPYIPDSALGVRLNPEYPSHDQQGFRNPTIRQSLDVVALGDSQTYGVGVLSEESWPHQLSQLSGKSVYNMGVPSYGPDQNLALMTRAVSFHPRWVIEAVYAGNDLWDAYYTAYHTDHFADLRSRDAAVLAAINEAESHGRMKDEFAVGPGLREPSEPGFLRAYLAGHSSLWGLMRAVKTAAVSRTHLGTTSPETHWADVVSQARNSGGQWLPFEKGPVRTILTPRYRFAALDLDDPRIRDGFRISVEVVRRMFAIAQHDGAHFTVVLIPTKELVFLDTFGWSAPTTAGLDQLQKLTRNEREMWVELKNELRTSGISYVDTLPVLRNALNVGDSPYPLDNDGHPNARGHQAIADAIWTHLQGIDEGKGSSLLRDDHAQDIAGKR